MLTLCCKKQATLLLPDEFYFKLDVEIRAVSSVNHCFGFKRESFQDLADHFPDVVYHFRELLRKTFERDVSRWVSVYREYSREKIGKDELISLIFADHNRKKT